MIWINFDIWNSAHGMFFSSYRIYRNGRWTPFVRLRKRYASWLGYWGR